MTERIKLTDNDIDTTDIEGHECVTISSPYDYKNSVYAGSAEDKIRTDKRIRWVLTIKQQILQNQEIVERLREFLQDPLNNPEAHGIVFHNPEYAEFLQSILGEKK